jgi:hypothetical protein
MPVKQGPCLIQRRTPQNFYTGSFAFEACCADIL